MKQVLRYFQIFEKWSPRRKFSIMLIFIYVVSVPVISIVTYFILKQNAIIAASNAARLYLYSIESTKRYIEMELRPILLKEIPDRFIIEGMSRSYVAAHIAAGIQEKLPYYKYKNASLNPRNPNNKADEFETDVINEFISNKEKKEWVGFRSTPEGQYYVVARPGKPFSADCLLCHGDPSKAPREIRERYGLTGGFIKKIGEIADAIMIYIPISAAIASAKKIVAIFIGMYTMVFGIIFLVIDMRFKHLYKIIESDKEKIEEIDKEILRLNQDLEAIVSERTIGMMALRVADRIRNPATVIGCLTRRMLEREKLPEACMEKLKDIFTQSQMLERIVSDFEFLVKSKKFIFRREDINEIISSTISSVEQELKSKGIELSTQLSDEPLYFNANKQLLKIAFGHLLKNSIEATPRGGKIFLYTGKVNEDIFFTIRDTGHGIPAKYMDKIFDPFFSTKEGMGMGLPLTKQIVEDHLGVITAESTPGEGSTFRISFPIVWKEYEQKSNFEKGIDRE